MPENNRVCSVLLVILYYQSELICSYEVIENAKWTFAANSDENSPEDYVVLPMGLGGNSDTSKSVEIQDEVNAEFKMNLIKDSLSEEISNMEKNHETYSVKNIRKVTAKTGFVKKTTRKKNRENRLTNSIFNVFTPKADDSQEIVWRSVQEGNGKVKTSGILKNVKGLSQSISEKGIKSGEMSMDYAHVTKISDHLKRKNEIDIVKTTKLHGFLEKSNFLRHENKSEFIKTGIKESRLAQDINVDDDLPDEHDIPPDILYYLKYNRTNYGYSSLFIPFQLPQIDYYKIAQPSLRLPKNDLYFDLSKASKLFKLFTLRYLKTFPSKRHRKQLFNIFQNNLKFINSLNERRSQSSSVVYGITMYAGMDLGEKRKIGVVIARMPRPYGKSEGKEFAKPVYDRELAPQVFEKLVRAFSMKSSVRGTANETYRHFSKNLILVNKYHLDPEFMDVIHLSPEFTLPTKEFEMYLENFVNKQTYVDVNEVEMRLYKEEEANINPNVPWLLRQGVDTGPKQLILADILDGKGVRMKISPHMRRSAPMSFPYKYEHTPYDVQIEMPLSHRIYFEASTTVPVTEGSLLSTSAGGLPLFYTFKLESFLRLHAHRCNPEFNYGASPATPESYCLLTTKKWFTVFLKPTTRSTQSPRTKKPKTTRKHTTTKKP